MGLVAGAALLFYLVFVWVPALLAFRRNAPTAATPRTRATSVIASLAGIALHVALQVAKPLSEGYVYPFEWILHAWIGIPTFVVAGLAALFVHYGRRERSPIELALARGLCASLLAFPLLPLLEWPVVAALGVRVLSS